jgi:hypothetical protein
MKRSAAFVLILGCTAFLLGANTLVNLATQVTGVLQPANGGIGSTVLTPGTTVSADFSKGTVLTLVPAQTETINATNCTTGEMASIVVTTSGTSSFTLTFSTNFKTTGTLATGTISGKVFAVSFVCSGTTATELARTAAM